jgi:hypothetical protein
MISDTDNENEIMAMIAVIGSNSEWHKQVSKFLINNAI